jgi:adenosine deaminase
LKKRAREITVLTPEPELVVLAKQLQLRMRNYILEKGVAVESCPSSNFLISNLEEFKDIPTFNLFPIQESSSDFVRLNVSINTDDQGVFFTSLQKEYAMLAGTLRELHDSNGLRIYSDDQILNWIEHLINNSKQQCFGSIG